MENDDNCDLRDREEHKMHRSKEPGEHAKHLQKDMRPDLGSQVDQERYKLKDAMHTSLWTSTGLKASALDFVIVVDSQGEALPMTHLFSVITQHLVTSLQAVAFVWISECRGALGQPRHSLHSLSGSLWVWFSLFAELATTKGESCGGRVEMGFDQGWNSRVNSFLWPSEIGPFGHL